MANNVVSITGINFDSIKSSLKTYLSSQPDFLDYDFESSTMQTILTLLAHNTYYQAFYLNMVGNEMFLDSAQLRNSVVSRAKMLGYTPRSARGATATLQVNITPDDAPSTITIDKNTEFSTELDGVSYTFVTPETYLIDSNNGVYTSNTISIVEGIPLTHRFTVSTASPVRYILPNPNVDTTSIHVRVQQSSSNTSNVSYTKAENLLSVGANSKIFFIQENEDQKYEVFFGDGITGKSLSDGNIVVIDSRVCNGSTPNGANTFSPPSTLGGYSNFSITTVSKASGGSDLESIQSIKFNAPKNFEAQGRAVTANDYKTLILSEYGDIQTINIWGGEENIPPIYGKVYISAKPFSSSFLSQQRKDQIVKWLTSRNMVSIDPVFVDPTYLIVVPLIEIRYDPKLTALTGGQILNNFRTNIINFENNNLGQFGGRFTYSKLMESLSHVENSVVSINMEIEMQRRFIPNVDETATYKLSFNNPIRSSQNDSELHTIEDDPSQNGLGSHLTSSYFTYNGITKCRFDCNGTGTIRIYYMSGGSRIYLNSAAGKIDHASGLVTLENIRISAYEGTSLTVNTLPEKRDIYGVRNQLLLIGGTKIFVRDDVANRLTAKAENISTQGESIIPSSSGTSSILF